MVTVARRADGWRERETMRIAELSRRTGVPVSTIKYYLREGLLPSGQFSSPTQARYTDSHVHRLRLVRVLLDTGGLGLADIGRLLGELDQPDPDVRDALSRAVRSPRSTPSGGHQTLAAAAAVTDELVRRHGWRIDPGGAARRAAIAFIAAAWEVGVDVDVAALDTYARAAQLTMEADRALAPMPGPCDGTAFRRVAAVILGDGLLTALRRLADQDGARPR